MELQCLRDVKDLIFWIKCLQFITSRSVFYTGNARLYKISTPLSHSNFCVVKELMALLNGLDISKAMNPDGISGRMLKRVLVQLLLNRLIRYGEVLIKWKKGFISPANYTPISLMSLASKILERTFVITNDGGRFWCCVSRFWSPYSLIPSLTIHFCRN